ncbi:MAG: sigma 54-interacting transcriptional regulator [Polyangiaceae bacterium]|jgi:DNA-binding NtrC family response regulator|nr:sigma 54-interacting transcriptional regulator [Polyangiaceae bacterium]
MIAESVSGVTWADLVASLRAATTFEEAATVTLRPMIDLATAALAASRFGATGKIVRGMIHLRPADGYRRLVVLEAGGGAVTGVEASETRLPSTTAWRWVAEHKVAVSVDVNLGRVQIDRTNASRKMPELQFGGGELSGQESRVRLLERAATHLYVIPLRGSRSLIDGMISLEGDCRAAIGQPFVWGEIAEVLQLLADLATPYLASLPPAPGRRSSPDPFLPVIGESLSNLIDLLRVFVQQEEPILISGPTGAGKSRLARWCHEQSPVKAQPFETLDLSAIPEDLQMAELFGWKKGAFTGAIKDNPGVIARARGGTLFIDEIDNLSARAQAGLLHVLEERTYRVLGDEGGEKSADVRFIVGTNATLEEAVRQKRFRQDLYYRINVLPVRLPPLAERPDEIAPWARYMLERRHTKRFPAGHADLTPGAQAALVHHPWPGNLRQLDNIIRRAYAIALMAQGGVTPQELRVEEAHINRALAYEGSPSGEPTSSSAVSALVAAASALVIEAELRAAAGGSLDLDWADAFKGFVLGVATEKLGGNRDEAFRLLGREKLVASRNHHKVWKRELERAEQLCTALGGKTPFPFAKLLDDVNNNPPKA